MKKTLFALTMAVALFISTQAKSQETPTSPSDVALGYIKSMVTFDIKGMEKFVRSEDSANLVAAEPMLEEQLSSIPDSVKQIMKNLKYAVSNEKISGDSASVDVTISGDEEGGESKTQTINLVKENAIWKAILEMGGGQ